MAERDIIRMSQKELKRLHVIHRVREGFLTQKEAAEMISLSERQIRRIVRRIREEGERGIQHRSRGKESNRRLSKKLVERVTRLYQERYQGFGPTLMAEKLYEREGIAVSRETIRQWLLESGQWQKERKGLPVGRQADHTGSGGSGRVIMGRCSSWTGVIMTGLQGGGLPVYSWPTSMMPRTGCMGDSTNMKALFLPWRALSGIS